MKIAVSAQGKTLDFPVDLRFGRCPFFLIFDNSQETVQILLNPAVDAQHGAGISAAHMILNVGVQVVLTGDLGSNALIILRKRGIRAFKANPGNVAHAINQYRNNELEPITTAGPMHSSRSDSLGTD